MGASIQSGATQLVKSRWSFDRNIPRGTNVGQYGLFTFVVKDENYSVAHNRRGIVGMANKGRHTNGSQFYITLQPAPWMDTKYVAFGQVIEGTKVLRQLEEQNTYNERPIKACKIEDCGLFNLDRNIPYPDD